MEHSLLQKLFSESSGGPCDWLAQVLKTTGASASVAGRTQDALRLFAQFGPLVEQDAFARADARLRDYAGTPFALEQRSTLEAVFVAAAYSKLALALAVILTEDDEEHDPGPLDSSLRHDL